MNTMIIKSSTYFAYKFVSIIVCLYGLELPLNILNKPNNVTTYQLIFAYSAIVILPVACGFFLWQIINTKSYKSVYPFKWFC